MAQLLDTTITGDLSVSGTATAIAQISTGSTAPSSTPSKVGDIYVDTTAGNVYISKGNSSSADWVQVN